MNVSEIERRTYTATCSLLSLASPASVYAVLICATPS